MSKEFNVFNSRLLNVSKELAGVRLGIEEIQADHVKDQSYLQDAIELKMSKEFNVFNSRLLNVSKELAGVRLGIEEIQADHVKDQSHLQDAIELKMSKEFSTFTKQLVKELKMSKEFNVFSSRLLNVSKELAGVRLGIEEIQADHVKDPSYLQDAIGEKHPFPSHA
ncbi:hypothetical protein KIL84_020929 [Mauremys mutica]|uniref:Uncharacterized protein n=1 Tax=Mauremys mutica TaxID=74926 RepID=A0A9D3XBX0_9SAUR|nr:hypothetical protein KIL84_020929 [Mauremys mutica]